MRSAADRMMIATFVALVVLPVLWNQRRGGQAPSKPLAKMAVIVVDEVHNAMEGVEVYYEIDPAHRLLVDSSSYHFHSPREGAKRPTSIYVFGHGGYYRAEAATDARVHLDSSTLHALGDSPRFAGFRSGHTYFISFGEDDVQVDTHTFRPCWLGAVRVR